MGCAPSYPFNPERRTVRCSWCTSTRTVEAEAFRDAANGTPGAVALFYSWRTCRRCQARIYHHANPWLPGTS